MEKLTKGAWHVSIAYVPERPPCPQPDPIHLEFIETAEKIFNLKNICYLEIRPKTQRIFIKCVQESKNVID